MTWYLLKTEPDEFSYDDLVRAKREPWDGVTNPAAQKYMRAMAKGDRAFIYHTGGERRIAGTAKVVKGAYPDPDKPQTLASGEPKFVLVDLAPDRAAPDRLTLADVKQDAAFQDFELVRQPRLSVMPVPDTLADRLLKGAGLA
ncbi:MAG: EVE domain-containing protein [Planctomycetota bacterium]